MFNRSTGSVMQFTLETDSSIYMIRAYEPGRIIVNEQVVTRSAIISPRAIISDWPPQHVIELQQHHIRLISELSIAVLLIGTGKTLQFPTPGVTQHLLEQGIGVEIMDTPAACRTYNVLVAEGRAVAAAVFMI